MRTILYLVEESQTEQNFANFFKVRVRLSVCVSVCLSAGLLAALKNLRRVSYQDKLACELWLGVLCLLVDADCEIFGFS